MAYPNPPRTWVDTEFVNAALLNAQLRDALNAMGPHLIARKVSDQSVTSSTAFVSDTALTMTVGTSEVWLFKFFTRYEGGTTGDFKVSFSLPASGQIDATASGAFANTVGTFADAQWQALVTTDSQAASFAGAGAATPRILMIDGVYIGAGTAGSVTLRWAQATSDGTATKVLTHSTLWAVKLA